MDSLQKILQLETTEVAKKLLGHYLISKQNNVNIIGKIVETEAYLENDEAAHSFNGKTKRNLAMYAKAGTCYVYISYGLHYCMNIVTTHPDKGEAVLIRALEPISGIKQMQINRSKTNLIDLCSGPGKLTQALGISLKDNNKDLLSRNSQFYLSYNNHLIDETQIVATPRVGISKAKEKPYRFYIRDNKFISRK